LIINSGKSILGRTGEKEGLQSRFHSIRRNTSSQMHVLNHHPEVLLLLTDETCVSSLDLSAGERWEAVTLHKGIWGSIAILI